MMKSMDCAPLQNNRSKYSVVQQSIKILTTWPSGFHRKGELVIARVLSQMAFTGVGQFVRSAYHIIPRATAWAYTLVCCKCSPIAQFVFLTRNRFTRV